MDQWGVGFYFGFLVSSASLFGFPWPWASAGSSPTIFQSYTAFDLGLKEEAQATQGDSKIEIKPGDGGHPINTPGRVTPASGLGVSLRHMGIAA